MMPVLILLMVTTLLLGCASKAQYREYAAQQCDETSQECSKASFIRSRDKYVLGFVEIDDQGVMLDRRQGKQILDYIGTQDNLYIIVYVHGWHHNASQSDSNINSFKRRLNFTQLRYPNKQVVGVYVGWRGESVTVPILNIMTFWDRKNVSEEVGKNQLLEFLFELEKARGSVDRRNTLLTVGHSFGGSAVYNALGQTLVQRLMQRDGEFVRGFGDLVVLVNPAIESMRFTALRDASEEEAAAKGYSAKQPTILIVTSSSADLPVRTLFPIGRSFSTLWESHRNYVPPTHLATGAPTSLSEAEMDRHALGHYPPYLTHHLDANRSSGNNYDCPSRPGWYNKAVERQRARQRALGEAETGEGWDTGNHTMGPGFEPLIGDPSEMQLRHVNQKSHAFNPYWIVSTDESVIPNHNEISSKHFWCFIDLVIQEGGGPFVPPKEAPRVLTEPPENARSDD